MSHIPVSIIVAASGSRDDLHACLEALRPTIGLRDEVVCVLPPGRDDLGSELRRRTWPPVVEAPSAEPAKVWSTGLEATRHPVVVLLDGDVVVSANWLDPVLVPFEDGEVVATGPMCHLSYGPQGTALPDHARAGVADFKAFARQWRQEHRGELTPVDRLGPVCVAVRRDALTLAGGPTLDMPYGALHAQGRMVIARASLVAHVGSAECFLRNHDPEPGPLLSASLIVKDEEEVIAGCLTALRDFVDEMVVYDTGSTDRTVQIAQQHGATVIEGFWNDHFGDARNRSLAHCRGAWILWIDADEVAVGDPAAIRKRLSNASEQAFLIVQENKQGFGTGSGETLVFPRLFRRAQHQIYGRLHEQVADRVNGRLVSGSLLPDLVLDHSGYTVQRGTLKDKGARNLRLAEMSGGDVAGLHDITNLARSQLAAGDARGCVETCRRGLAKNPAANQHITLLKALVSATLQLRNLPEANEALAELRGVIRNPLTADDTEAHVRYQEGDYERTLELVQNFPDSATNDLFYVVGRDQLAELEINCLTQLGRHQEAGQRLSECLESGNIPVTLARISAVLAATGAGMAEVAALVPRHSLRALLFTAGTAPTELADELLEALWPHHRGDPALLAVASRVGQHRPLLRAMEWSARLRQAGFAEECTLLALAADARRSSRERSLAAAITVEMYGDEAGMPLLSHALQSVSEADCAAVLDDMRLLTPRVAASIEYAPA